MLSSAEIYNPASNSWSEAAGLAQPRYGHALQLLADGQVIVLGGARAYDYTGSNPWTQASFVRAIQSYNPLTDRWTQVGELQQPEAYAATVLLPDGRLWVTGGGAGADLAKAWADTWLLAPAAALP